MTPQIQAIQTVYNRRRFRSRLEARWAVFFDTAGIIWEYEPEGFHVNGGQYLPDFWLPQVRLKDYDPGIYIEVKPEPPPISEINKYRSLVVNTGRNLGLVCGSGFMHGESTFEGFHFGSIEKCKNLWWSDNPERHIWFDDKCCFQGCLNCGEVYFTAKGDNCAACGDGVLSDIPFDRAVTAALSARFESF